MDRPKQRDAADSLTKLQLNGSELVIKLIFKSKHTDLLFGFNVLQMMSAYMEMAENDAVKMPGHELLLLDVFVKKSHVRMPAENNRL